MNFEFGEEQILLRNTIREFAEREISPLIKEYEEKGEYPLKILKKLSELGIMGMEIPAQYGGNELSKLSEIIIIEELARICPSTALIICVHNSVFCYPIAKFGTEEQKKKYLPLAAQGKIIGGFCLTEPHAGSDAANQKTKAIKKGDFYILNGIKSWVTNATIAQALIIIAVTDPEKGRKGISAFIVNTSTPGLKISKIEDKMGLKSSQTAEIVLEDCKVPIENLLGEEGMGIKIALNSLDGSRIGIAAQSVGLAQRALEEAIKYSKQRYAFNKQLSEFQAIQFMIADMATMLEGARLLTYRAADLKDKGKSYTKEASMAKLYASEVTNKIVYQALQIHGAYGYSKEFIIEKLYRDARVLTIYEGTSEIQRLIISRHLFQEN
ncbi:acyl-CoA dehydrogenase [Candidatus Aminicenantes bacterium AH-873-B07]|nr:acyl-CoA dehydrogenase [Candidatus Aminicenantes bacterium AH-873-B07]